MYQRIISCLTLGSLHTIGGIAVCPPYICLQRSSWSSKHIAAEREAGVAGEIINQAVWGILTQDYAAQLKRINYLSFGKKERELTRKMASKMEVASQHCDTVLNKQKTF